MAKRKRRNPILKVLKVVVVVHLLLVMGNLIGYIYSRLGNTHTIAVSGEWNLVVVNRWNELPEDYDIELMELSNGQKIDERITIHLFDVLRYIYEREVILNGRKNSKKEDYNPMTYKKQEIDVKTESSNYICCSTYGKPRSKDFHWQYFKQLLQENDLPDIRWHDLRATYCTILLKNDFNPKQYQN